MCSLLFPRRLCSPAGSAALQSTPDAPYETAKSSLHLSLLPTCTLSHDCVDTESPPTKAVSSNPDEAPLFFAFPAQTHLILLQLPSTNLFLLSCRCEVGLSRKLARSISNEKVQHFHFHSLTLCEVLAVLSVGLGFDLKLCFRRFLFAGWVGG